jgi:hypothetical protein
MNQQRAAPSDWLSVFEIQLTSASDLLYANGRQQAMLSIKITPRAGQTVSDDEMASVCVVERNNDGSYIPVASGTESSLWWMSQDRNEYDFYTPVAASDSAGMVDKAREHKVSMTPERSQALSTASSSPSPPEVITTKDFYLMTTVPGGTTNTFYAQITKDNGTVYVTDDVFTTTVKLTSVPTPAYSADKDYALTKTLVSGSENSGIFVYEFSINHNVYEFRANESSGNDSVG